MADAEFPRFEPQSTHPEYAQLHGGAHRKIATRFGVPSLVRHIGYWKPVERTQEQWINKIDERLLRLFQRLTLLLSKPDGNIIGPLSVTAESGDDLVFFKTCYRKDAQTPTPLDVTNMPELLKPNRFRVIIYRFKWHYIPATIRFELHTEYVTVSLILDASRTIPDQHIDSAKQHDEFNLFNDSFDELAKVMLHGFPKSASGHCLFDTLYTSLHVLFFNETLSPIGDSCKSDSDEIGRIFADFRTIIIGDRPETSADGINRFFRKPFSQSGQSSAAIDSDARIPDAHWASNILRAVLPFMQLPVPKKKPFSKFDLTASRLVDGRAIYITGLGPQPTKEATPLFGLYYWSKMSRWQVGRVLDRLHNLGILRLAAIIDVNKLRDIGTSIDAIETKLDDARKAFDKQPSALSERKDRLKEARVKLDQVHILFSRTDATKANRIDSIDGGLEYRVERSRYYVRQWRDGLKDLRILRIEGFQPYDSFVERRLGATFDYIHRLGLRYDRIKGETARLEQYYMTQASVISQETSVNLQRNIEDFQKWGEIALLVVLLPYYAGHLFIGANGYDEHEVHPKLWTIIWCLGIGAVSVRLAWKYFEDKDSWKGKSIPWRIKRTASITLITSVTAILFYYLLVLMKLGASRFLN